MSRIVFVTLLVAATLDAARAEDATDKVPQAPPEVLALSQMASECQRREALALVQSFTARIALTDATKRAEAAEAQVADLKAKLDKTVPVPAEPAPAK